MQNLIAFQFFITGGPSSPTQLPSHPVENGITIINNSSSAIYIGNSSGHVSAGTIFKKNTHIPLAGGNPDQIWVGASTRGAQISIIGT
jgi:hypothetical protein